MNRTRLASRFAVAALALLMTATNARAIDITWDGGDSRWDDTKWNGGSDAMDLVGTLNGSNGWGGPNEGEMENFFISGATSIVEYPADDLQSDFRMKQGSTLTISNGGVWQQITTDDWSENR
jgi:hypothetical protein